MTFTDVLVITAIVIGPVIAIRIQTYLDARKAARERKLEIFRKLMTTRATLLNPQHVEALNMIDIEFYKHQRIIDTWKELLDTLYNYPKQEDMEESEYKSRLGGSTDKTNELHANLLYEMGRDLGYQFDKVHLKRGAYHPQGHVTTELTYDAIITGIFDVIGEISHPY